MVSRVCLGIAILTAGCAPRVILSDEGAGGTSEDTDTAASSDSGGSSSSPATTQPPMPTIGPMSTSGPSSETFGSSGFFGSSSDDFPSGLCWSAAPLFEAPEESRLFVRDQDSDGLAELWLTFFEGGGGGRGGTSELFRFDTSGQPNPAGFFPGFLTGLHNINGDASLDGVGFAFGGGGPPRLGYIEGFPQLIEGAPTQLPFGFEDGFESFVDTNNDGLDDFLRSTAGAIELYAGDGPGGFLISSAIESGLDGDLVARPVSADPELFTVAQSGFFDDLDGCTFHPFELLRTSPNGLSSTIPSFPSTEYPATEVIGAEHFGAFTNVYARACTGDGVTMQVQRFEGNAVTQVDEYDPSSFAAYGDFDGDGQDDIGLGGPTLDTIRVYNGSAAGTFTEGVFDEVLFGEPVASRVFILDLDGDGRDEIILGTRDGGSEIAYQRLDLEPC